MQTPQTTDTLFIRPYQPSDLPEMAALFYRTVHEVNARDYTREQLDVWATGQIDEARWSRSLQEHISLVAVSGGLIVGFADMDPSGYLDRLYIHADHQHRGIATALCDRLEAGVTGDISTHASITARGFFEKRGYLVLREQQGVLQGVPLTNYVMLKARPAASSPFQRGVQE